MKRLCKETANDINHHDMCNLLFSSVISTVFTISSSSFFVSFDCANFFKDSQYMLSFSFKIIFIFNLKECRSTLSRGDGTISGCMIRIAECLFEMDGKLSNRLQGV